jgi:hypothetical protein
MPTTTNPKPTKPKLTPKQHQILHLIYRHRFVNRIQLQALLGHKDKKQIGVWLKDLRERGFLGWVYSTGFTEKTKPATYYLGLNGIRFLRTFGQYLPEELRKRYRESSRETSFIARCLLLTDCCISLLASDTKEVQYSFLTAPDLADPESDYHFLTELSCQLFVTKKTSETTQPYLVEVLDATLPRYRVRKRLKDYVNYLDNEEWEAGADELPLVVLLVCPTKADLIYAKRRTRRLIEDAQIPWNVRIRFAIAEQVTAHGMTGKIWEPV